MYEAFLAGTDYSSTNNVNYLKSKPDKGVLIVANLTSAPCKGWVN